MTELFDREITPQLLRALSSMPAVVLTGMRQVGKSTLLQVHPKLSPRTYFTLDDYTYLQAARDNPESLLTANSSITIDEVQRCPELLIAIKKEIDLDRRTGRYLLSGSANFSLLKNVSESLAGRAVYLNLGPFSRRELLKRTTESPFLKEFLTHPEQAGSGAWNNIPPFDFSEVVTGGMPEVLLNPAMEREIWFRGFEQTYLERDIRDLGQVADRLRFRNLMQLAALRTAQLLNISELGRDAGLNAMTATRYLSVMEASFVIHKLQPYLKNPSSRIIKSPKLYFTDSGIASYLSGVSDLSPAKAEPQRGQLLETYVAQNLESILAAHLPGARLFFWNIQGRHEVDFVIETPKSLIAIEVKASSRWEKRDLSGIQAFMESHPHCESGILAYCGDHIAEISPSIWAVPIGKLLS